GTPPGSFRACGTALPRTSAWPMRASSWRCVYHRRSLHCEEAMIHDSILGTIGNTPIVRINRLAPRNTTIYVKCEAFNPMSSWKDRLAIAMIEDAERRGTLRPGQTVIEPTSGNTGIALAMVCAAKGYPFVAVMSDSFSVERRKLMKGMGAKVVLTPAAERGSGMVRKAEELAKKHGWFLPQQFENPSNPEYHRNTTGPEILRDFAGRDVRRRGEGRDEGDGRVRAAGDAARHGGALLDHVPVRGDHGSVGRGVAAVVANSAACHAPETAKNSIAGATKQLR